MGLIGSCWETFILLFVVVAVWGSLCLIVAPFASLWIVGRHMGHRFGSLGIVGDRWGSFWLIGGR